MSSSDFTFPALSQDAVREYILQSGDGSLNADQLEVVQKTCEIPYPHEVERNLRALLDDIQNQFSELSPRSKGFGAEVESYATGRVHACLSAVPEEAKLDPDYWVYLSMAIGSDFVDWRFGAEKTRNPSNFGTGVIEEGLLYRLYVRAELAFEPDAEDPYEIAALGDMDLWRSHILRVNYARYKPIIRSLLLLQGGHNDGEKLQTKQIRELARELNRVYTNVAFEYLSITEAEDLVLELSGRSVRGTVEVST